MYEIIIRTHFSAAHSLRGYPGKCARPHGHNWVVEITVRCRKLNELGIGIDFKELRELADEAASELDHRDLNTIAPFDAINPTSENIAAYFYRTLSERLDGRGVAISRVMVSETPDTGAIYWEDEEGRSVP